MADSCSFKALFALAAALAFAGCAGSAPKLPTITLPSPPTVEAASQRSAATPPQSAPGVAQQDAGVLVDQTGGEGGSATDIYSRLASGAMKCWFSVGAPLKSDFVYHATATPASRGGKAQIAIHRRDPTQPNPRGAKAYLVDIDPSGETSATVIVKNLKMTDAFASAMTSDVTRWTKGGEGCSQSSAIAGWTPAAPLPVETATAATSKAAKKRKPKATPTTAQAKVPAKPPLKAAADN